VSQPTLPFSSQDIEDCAKAVEMFGEDELERFAQEFHRYPPQPLETDPEQEIDCKIRYGGDYPDL